MINFSKENLVYIAISPIDFRLGLNKLAIVSEAVLKKSPRRGGIFVFRNKRGTDIKLILYHKNGFFMGHKRLSKGKLSWWPRNETESLDISADELIVLLLGVDPRGTFHPDRVEFSSTEHANLYDSEFRNKFKQSGTCQFKGPYSGLQP